jgi:DNA-binding response OmpR family regulator
VRGEESAASNEREPGMSALRVLHVDDEPDIRTTVEISLGQDPAFAVRTCESSRDALAIVSEWSPHLILTDVKMPGMDGLAMLARLRESEATARIPVVFMTARTDETELAQLKRLGATGVIAKPFDPITLPSSVRAHLRAAGMGAVFHGFIHRLQSDAEALAECRLKLGQDRETASVLDNVKAFAHALAGTAGIFGLHEISRCASELEETAIGKNEGNGDLTAVEVALDQLLAVMELR